MGRDHGHPYILSTTVLSDTHTNYKIHCLINAQLHTHSYLFPLASVLCDEFNNAGFILYTVSSDLSFSTEDTIVVEGNVTARVCVVLNIALTVNLQVEISSNLGSG